MVVILKFSLILSRFSGCLVVRKLEAMNRGGDA